MSTRIILDLCGGTGSWSRPYRDAGYDVRIITLPDYDVTKWRQTDLLDLAHSNTVHGILAAPPCTMFSLARNDKTAKTPRDLRGGMKIVQSCLDLIHECVYEPFQKSKNSLQFWALENPRGHLQKFLGKPAFEFDPCEFGDPYTKRTLLWGNFNEPKRTPVKPLPGVFVKHPAHFYHLKEDQLPDDYLKKTGYAKSTVVRSITPKGFAQAFFEANP